MKFANFPQENFSGCVKFKHRLLRDGLQAKSSKALRSLGCGHGPHGGARGARLGLRRSRATRFTYNSCRNRHRPKRKGQARAQWLADRQAAAARTLFPFRVHLAAGGGRDRFPKQGSHLWPDDALGGRALELLAAKRLGARLGLIALLHTGGLTLT